MTPPGYRPLRPTERPQAGDLADYKGVTTTWRRIARTADNGTLLWLHQGPGQWGPYPATGFDILRRHQ